MMGQLFAVRGAGVLLACAMLAGCCSDMGWPKRYPVTGQVLVDGKPAVRAVVTFHPAGPHPDGKTYAPSTFTDDDGRFRLTTFEAGDGAPPGDYTVTVVASYIFKDGQDIPVKDLLKGRYADPKSSQLKITVREEDNALAPFDLKSTPKS